MTSFDDMLKADIDGTFLNLEEFGKEITYTPEQGGKAKKIKAIVTEGQDSEILTGADVWDFDVTEILINALDNTLGHILPKVTGRDNEGDKVNITGAAGDFFVKEIMEEGSASGGGLHRLLIANTGGILLE